MEELEYLGENGAMWTINIRLGLAEFFTLASLLVVSALLIPAFLVDWAIALVPTLGYAAAIGVTYTLYRRYAAGRAAVAEPAAEAVTFRVVDVRGVCPLGRREGDLVTVGPARTVAPALCPPAQAVLRLAAEAGEGQEAEQWCCPIFDHLLVFQRQLKAA